MLEDDVEGREMAVTGESLTGLKPETGLADVERPPDPGGKLHRDLYRIARRSSPLRAAIGTCPFTISTGPAPSRQ